jgi:hypothetical protein
MWLSVISCCVAQQLPCAPGELVPQDYDEYTQRCNTAFCALPLEDRIGKRFNFGQFSSHVMQNRGLFKTFLTSCFSKLDGLPGDAGLQEDTKAFVLSVYGVLFRRESNKLILTCSAFRISETVLVTARHCLYDRPDYQPSPQQFIFRSLSSPLVDVPILGERANQANTPRSTVANDFDDYWYLIIPKGALPFGYTNENFKGDFPRQIRMLLGGVNLAVYILENTATPSRWPLAYRFSKVTGSQWLSVSDLRGLSDLSTPPSRQAEIRCIYHKASSYGGMSGSPIIGEQHIADGSRKLFVFGIHLRTGAPDDAHRTDADCGAFPGINIGLALPQDVLAQAGTR